MPNPKHYGFGLFSCETPKGELTFDAGGLMYSEYDSTGEWWFSWTYLRGRPEAMKAVGYNQDKTIKILKKLLKEYSDEGVNHVSLT